jgi:signal transduction histidine kinase
METFYQQLITLFIIPPGNLIYHIVLVFAVTAALQGILINRRPGQGEYPGRALLGLGMVLVGQVALFMVSGLAWQGMVNPHVVLPPLDRAAALFSILWIIWLWAFPHAERLADGLAGLISVAVVIAFFFTWTQWAGQPPAMVFSGSVFDVAWELATLGLILIGILILALRRPLGWGIGLGFLLVNLAGHSVQFVWPNLSGDFSGIVRLAQLCSFPLLPALALRLQPQGASQVIQPGVQFKVAPQAALADHSEPGVMRERRRYSADPRAVQAWLDVATQTDAAQMLVSVTRAVAQTMLADICFYVTESGSDNELVFQVGYDLIREDEIPGMIFSRDQLPSLASSLQRGRSYRLEPGSSTADLKTLGERFGLKKLGSLLFIPLTGADKKPGGFLLLSPYSDRSWTLEDQNYFAAAVEPLAKILQHKSDNAPTAEAAPSANAELENLKQMLDQARLESQHLKDEVSNLRKQPANLDVESLLLVQKEAQDTINNLQSENERLRRAAVEGSTEKSPVPGEVSYLEMELRNSLMNVAHLQNKLAETNMQMLTLQKQVSQPVRMINEEREVVASIAQELRQPMASIVGYIDLLLSESAGILGALQRKFLDRVKNSIDRMHSILDDLVQITTLQNSNIDLVARPVQASAAIDQALEETRAQFQQKNIVLQLDLPDELPELYADPDAIQQILVHLLQNAGAATPVEGTILLKVRIDQSNAAEPYLLFQITDSGGGIAPTDLPKVFSRRYRADHPLILGIGDTGVGLSIAKTLTEAHGGRIWVESEPGKSATFSVLLPLRPFKKADPVEPVS